MDDHLKTKAELIEELISLRKRIAEETPGEHKQEEEKLRVSNQQLLAQTQELTRMATVVKDSNDAITIQDLEGNITAWNAGAVKTYGYSEQEALKMNVADLVPEAYKAEALNFIASLKKGELVESLETKRLTKDGKTLDIWMVVTKLVDEDGKLIGAATTERDITERKKIERQFYQVEKLASIRELTSGLAHKLRNPLAGISSTAQYGIDNLEVSGECKDAFEAIKRNSDSAGQMIYELLHFADSKQMNIKTNNLLSSLEKVHEMIESDFYQQGVCFIKENMDSKIIALYDEESIKEVLINVYSNALQSLKEGGLIRTSLSSSDDHAIVEIEDNGCGIAEGNFSKLFEPYFSTKEKGTGLGLSICHRILESQNGSIIVESKINQGTIVTVRLPKEPNATK